MSKLLLSKLLLMSLDLVQGRKHRPGFWCVVVSVVGPKSHHATAAAFKDRLDRLRASPSGLSWSGGGILKPTGQARWLCVPKLSQCRSRR